MHARLVWGLFAVFGAAIFVTYARLPPEELYNVSERGLDAGAGRLLVFVNYPVSIAAIPIAWFSAERIRQTWAVWAAAAATALCAVTAWPGVVDQHDLDAKAVNVVPALGVAIAILLSLRARREPVGRRPLDPVRIGLAVVFAVGAVPWIAAVLGTYAPGDVFLGEEIRRGGEGTLYAAVHLGDHEGLDGTLLALSALVLSRLPSRPALTLYVALLFVYGTAVAVNDFWFEQIVKRGWTDADFPDLLHPRVSIEWAVAFLLAIGLAVAVRRLEAPERLGEDPPRTGPSPVRGTPSGGSRTDERSP